MLTGWCRNTSFGVEMEVQGEEDSIRELISGLESGVSAAQGTVRDIGEVLPLSAVTQSEGNTIPLSDAIKSEGNALLPPDVVESVRETLPPLAVIESVSARELDFDIAAVGTTAGTKTGTSAAGFIIMDSVEGEADTLISPDIGTCSECLSEFNDTNDRRYHFPFINCTNCGPRFTIIRKLPYDRARTSMAGFKMCPECESEYRDIRTRRYHAQPDCCSSCGPRLYFRRSDRPVSSTYESVHGFVNESAHGSVYESEHGFAYESAYGSASENAQAASSKAKATDYDHANTEAVRAAVKLLENGGILCVKGLGGFHLACLTDEEAVKRLRSRKERYGKPLAVMVRDLETASRLGNISRKEKEMLENPRRPIVLIKKRGGADLLRWVSNSSTVGVMLPYTPLHELLFKDAAYDALIMTSANISGLPTVISNEEAFAAMGNVADGFLYHDRDIARRCDDSLLSVRDGSEYFYRRSRGYVPQPIKAPFDVSGIIACGAELKASFAIGKGQHIFYSQHIGDLKNAETYAFYCRQAEDFEELFNLKPEKAVCDRHPDYLSTRYAEEICRLNERFVIGSDESTDKNAAGSCDGNPDKYAAVSCDGNPVKYAAVSCNGNPVKNAGSPDKRSLGHASPVRVWHHHAHMASCMADNGFSADEKCIGLTWDGTGLGPDGTVWGAEVLYGGYSDFTRMVSVSPFRLPGGDAVIEETGRTAFSLLYESTASETTVHGDEKLPLLSQLSVGEKKILLKMLERGINSPYASSMGRLFDGVYALITGEIRSSYDGEAPVLLETLAAGAPDEAGSYTVNFINDIHSTEQNTLPGLDITSADQNTLRRLDISVIIRELAADISNGIKSEVIAMKFHNTIVSYGINACLMVRERTGEDKVVLSGGSFYNEILFDKIKKGLEAEGFRVFMHRNVSCCDEGIALGQLCIAASLGKPERSF